MKILYKVTSRSRPDNLKRTLLNIQEMSTNPNYLICLTLDEDDKTVNNPAFTEWINENFWIELSVFYGKSKNKIDAINRDLQHFTFWDILVNVSDDQVFTVKGFDQKIIDAFKFANGTDLFLHFRDTNHDPIDALCTLSIIGQDYFKRDGFIYDPRFKSFYCDNLSQDLAKARGCYRFIPDVIFDHLHPSYGKAQSDQQYKKNDLLWRHDENLYKRLKTQLHKLL
jgi:hypothetical protein